MAASVNFAGISSGIDSKAIIDAIVGVQKLPITSLQSKKSGYNDQISGIAKMTSALDELKTMMKDMQDTANVLAFTATPGDDKILTATISGAASSGTYEITVNGLARAEKDRSVALNSGYEPIKAGTITLTAAGQDPVDVAIADGDTLNDVVDKINASGAHVDASVVSDGTHSYLQVVASDTGFTIGGLADDALTISESYTGTTGTELGLSQVIQAKNALLEMDGLPVEQRSNTLTSVISDVSVVLKTEGTTTLQIDSDREGTKTKIQGFVDKFNEVLKLVDDSTTTKDGKRSIDPDPALLQIKSALRSLVGQSVTGIQGNTTSLSRAGVRTNASGQLEINATDFTAALDQDPRAVARLFTQPDSGVATKMSSLIDRYTNTIDGVLGSRTKSLNTRIDAADNQIARLQDRVDSLTARLTRHYTAMEATLSAIQMQGQALSSSIFGNA